MTLKPGARLVADANVILSAVTGKAALRAFIEFGVQAFVAAHTLDKILEYLPVMAKSYGQSPHTLETQLRLLALQVRGDYLDELPRARALIEKRDPDDVEIIALALKLDLPIWSNDRDIHATGLEVYTTARLLKVLSL